MAKRLVCIVDDDESVRESLPDFLGTYGFEVEAFSSAEAFLAAGGDGRAGCLILDVVMPGMSGVALQLVLLARGRPVPIVFITSSDDDAVKPRVMARGAVACLFKPFSAAEMLEAVNTALDSSGDDDA